MNRHPRPGKPIILCRAGNCSPHRMAAIFSVIAEESSENPRASLLDPHGLVRPVFWTWNKILSIRSRRRPQRNLRGRTPGKNARGEEFAKGFAVRASKTGLRARSGALRRRPPGPCRPLLRDRSGTRFLKTAPYRVRLMPLGRARAWDRVIAAVHHCRPTSQSADLPGNPSCDLDGAGKTEAVDIIDTVSFDSPMSKGFQRGAKNNDINPLDIEHPARARADRRCARPSAAQAIEERSTRRVGAERMWTSWA